MAKRVVLAYSGGLDTSVLVRWMQEEMGVEEVFCLCADVGQATTGDWEAIKERAFAAGAADIEVRDLRAEFADEILDPRAEGEREVRGQVPVGVRAVAADHREASGARCSPVGRRRGGTRLHRQGQRPGAIRGERPNARARPRGARPRAALGVHPGGLDPLRLPAQHPDHGDEREAVLDRRQRLGPGDRVWRDGRSVGGPAAGRLGDDRADGYRAA